MKGGDPFGKWELTIDITDYCSSLKPKATKHEAMVKPPFKQFHILKIFQLLSWYIFLFVLDYLHFPKLFLSFFFLFGASFVA